MNFDNHGSGLVDFLFCLIRKFCHLSHLSHREGIAPDFYYYYYNYYCYYLEAILVMYMTH